MSSFDAGTKTGNNFSSNLNLLEKFLETLSSERNASDNTIESYKRDLSAFIASKAVGDVTKADTSQIRKYISNLHREYAKSTISRHISAIRQFYVFLASESVISNNPARLIELPKKDKNLPKFLTERELDNIREFAREENSPMSKRFLVIFEILVGSGLRVSEVIGLKVNAIQKLDKNGRTNYFLMVKGKGGKERVTPLTSNTANSLEEYLGIIDYFLPSGIKPQQNIWLFPSKKKSKAGYITRQQAANIIKEFACKAGINPEKVSPHVLRHSFATNILQKGMDIRVLQEILGHSDISTTQIYTHTNQERLKNFIEKHHPLAKKNV
jgi:integrase/recombinase XerD